MDRKLNNVVDFLLLFWLNSTKEKNMKIRKRYQNKLATISFHKFRVFIIQQRVKKSHRHFLRRVARNMENYSHSLIFLSKIEIGTGRILILNTLNVEHLISQDMSAHIAWMPLQWLFILSGKPIPLRKQLSSTLTQEGTVIPLELLPVRQLELCMESTSKCLNSTHK